MQDVAFVAEECEKHGARHVRLLAAPIALHADLQRVEAKLDVLIEQFARRIGVERGGHADECFEIERMKFFDAARAELGVIQIVGADEARDVGADTVDLPADPALLSEELDFLNVAGHEDRNHRRTERKRICSGRSL